jgi:hypothetical protein
MKMRHRIVLVREWDAQTSGSGCCGRLDGISGDLGEEHTYAHVRADMEAMGAVYRALRAEWPADEVEISVVDPRNMIWLVPAIWRDGRRRGMSPGEVWRQVRQGVAQNAIIVDGKVVLVGAVPHPEEALAAVRAGLAAAV